MLKIAFFGAGSIGFGRRLIADIMSFPELADSTLSLVDPNRENLEFTLTIVRHLAEKYNLPTRFEASTDRTSALDGARYVITSIRAGEGMEPEAQDAQIPLDVSGLRQTIADTVGIGGVMKGLRTIPPLLDIARDMERYCPEALLLNYTNPMAMIQWALSEATSIETVGLCHSVQGTSMQLADYMGVDHARMNFRVAGINHMAWYTELSQEEEDLYPRLRACLDDPEIVARDTVRFEIMRHFGYFVTESTPHMSEYVPFFLKSDEEIERMGLSVRTGENNLSAETSRREQRQEALQAMEDGSLELERSHEYAAQIIHAIETDTPSCIHGNVPNTGLISNLTQGCCVEVPCFLDGAGLHPSYVGALPPQCAALCQTNVNMQGLTVRAVVEGNREYAYHAAMLDPNTAAQLSLPQIRAAMDALLDAQSELVFGER